MSLILAPDAAGHASAARALESADVVVAGAGPAGSAAAAHLAAAGLDVLLLDRAPAGARSGTAVLTPPSVAELRALGLAEPVTDAWHRTTGVRLVGGGMRVALAWPDDAGRPGHGLTCASATLDDTLTSYAVSRGARLRRGTAVTGLMTDAQGRLTGVTADELDATGQPVGAGVTVHAPVVLDATGTESSAQPSGVAVSADFLSPRHEDDHLEAWPSLATSDGRPLPGHGWVVGRGDGHVTVGVAAVAAGTTATTDHAAGVLEQWLTALPAGWQLTASTMTGPVTGTRLATAPTSREVEHGGVLRVGDAAGTAHLVTGEGLAGALVSARVAATVVLDALSRDGAVERERALTAYASLLDGALGRHHRIGRLAGRLLDRPAVARLASTYALPRVGLMTRALHHVTTAGTPVETCVTPPTMVSVTRAAAHPGTERGVDQR